MTKYFLEHIYNYLQTRKQQLISGIKHGKLGLLKSYCISVTKNRHKNIKQNIFWNIFGQLFFFLDRVVTDKKSSWILIY